MYKYIPKTKKLCINALATATMFGVVSLAVAQPLRTTVTRNESKDKIEESSTIKKNNVKKYKTEQDDNYILNDENIEIVKTSEKDVIFNQIGYRVPENFYHEK